jgi:hypothetical protein
VNAQAPKVAVVVASHNRALRLRWLLNSLEEQTLPRADFELIVAHDSDDGGATERLLRDHPVAARALRFDPEPGVPTAPKLRNAGWRAATAPLIAFTDDDCRAPADWLVNLVAAADANPGAIVQGTTMPDPDEEPNTHGTWPRTQRIVPPVPWAQACNIAYPRELLDRVAARTAATPRCPGSRRSSASARTSPNGATSGHTRRGWPSGSGATGCSTTGTGRVARGRCRRCFPSRASRRGRPADASYDSLGINTQSATYTSGVRAITPASIARRITNRSTA